MPTPSPYRFSSCRPLQTFKRVPGLTFADVLRTAAAEEGSAVATMVQIERSPTAHQSVNNFFSAVAAMQRMPGVSAVMMCGVGLRIEGRSGLYDLYWNPWRSHEFYAFDSSDPSYVVRTASL